MNSPIRSLPGSKKQFPNVQSKIDSKRQAIPSAPAVLVKMSKKEVKTIPSRPLNSGPKPEEQKVTLPSFNKVSQQPFRASPVPQSHYSQPFRPVLARKSPLPSNRVAVKRVDATKADNYAVDEVVAAVEAVEAIPIKLVVEKAILAGEAVDEVVATAEAVEVIPIEHVAEETIPAEEAVEEVLVAAEAVEIVAMDDGVEEVVEKAILAGGAVDEVVATAEAIPIEQVAEEAIPADEAVEEVLVAAEAVKIVAVDDAVEEVIFSLMVLEATPVEEAVHVPHLDAFATEAIVPHEASGTEKRKKRYRKKKSSASDVTSGPVVSVEAKPEAVEESAVTELTSKQKHNIHTDRRRSAAWKALRQTLGLEARIYIPSRHEAAKILAAKEVAFDVLSDTPQA